MYWSLCTEYVHKEREDQGGEDNDDGRKIVEESANKANKVGAEAEDKENLLQPKSSIPIFNKIGLKEE
jgi:hypothetical protein